ncbi:MAG: bifunctional D-glycero-beta-D-manno-heptose-7-phosphate kinase/D-glycero-beta-D-manno-heptose 1-phosphate adenylyltransferase HldE [Cellvibrionaceae bacterium]
MAFVQRSLLQIKAASPLLYMTTSIDLSSLGSSKVLVIGDVMLDSYIDGNTQRISPEAPVPVVHIQDNYQRPGGAANVALNIAALGAKAILLGLIGKDEAGQQLQQRLLDENVDSRLLSSDHAKTISKLRVISRNQQLIRLDTEDGFAHVNHDELLQQAIHATEEVTAVILSDYNKGTLRPILTKFLAHCKEKQLPVLVDPKGSDFSIYHSATLLTPNMSEFKAVAGDPNDEKDFQQRAFDLMKQHELKSLLVTRSEKGMSLFQQDATPFNLAAEVREVYDVTGAGDTVIATLATALGANYSFHDATTLANLAAGIVVGKMGTATVSLAELQTAIINKQHSDVITQNGILSLEDLLKETKLARTRGETLVMTNGCFDILHAGHVHYLNEARKLGDRLIVAVNSDASVKRLKGSERPINSLDNRMLVLDALACVDWVVAFDADTPATVIDAIIPDKLIKGGDYKAEEIVGYETVTQAGGEVLTIDLTPGCSTTNIINKAKGDY